MEFKLNNMLKDVSNYAIKNDVAMGLSAINESLGQQIKDRVTTQVFNRMRKDLEGKFFNLRSLVKDKFDTLETSQEDQDKEIAGLN